MNLIKHYEKTKYTEFGKELQSLVKEKVELNFSKLLDSEHLSDVALELMKEILGWDNLRATEGQIFKAAAQFCLRESTSVSEAKEMFETHLGVSNFKGEPPSPHPSKL